ncbi:MAG: hypothetical protein R2809_09365 [Flavobacteriales bacterium]
MKTLIKLNFIILLMFAACKRDPNSRDEPLCSARSNNVSNLLKLNGMYYYISQANSERAFIYILNANGTIGRTGTDLPLTNAQTKLTSPEFISFISDNKSYWGVYHIEGSNILIDTWHADSNGKDYGYRWAGEILSDTSFRIISSSLCNGSEFRNEDEVYYFYPLENKPDSVTSLIP